MTPWPWISGVIALAVFSPTLIWNAQHHWASVLYQYNRLVVHEWSLRYLGEFFGAQIGMATPFVFVLGAMGLVGLLRGQGGSFSARVLINAMVWPILLYFVWHTFHGRVEGNWPEPIFVPFVIAAAVAVERIKWQGVWASVETRLAAARRAGRTGIAAVIYVQAVFGVVPLGMADPTAAKLGAGWRELGVQMDEVRKAHGAPVVLTYDYGLASWLPSICHRIRRSSRSTAHALRERARARPGAVSTARSCMCAPSCAPIFRRCKSASGKWSFSTSLTRSRHGVRLQDYRVYRLSGPIGPPLDPP